MKSLFAVPLAFFVPILLAASAGGCSNDTYEDDVGYYRSSCANGVACDSPYTCSPTLEICVGEGEDGSACAGAADCLEGFRPTCRDHVCTQAVDIGGACKEHEDCQTQALVDRYCVRAEGQTAGTCRITCDPGGNECGRLESCCLYAPVSEYVCLASALCE